jgi:N-acetylmuramoyl-L-alanine amidase
MRWISRPEARATKLRAQGTRAKRRDSWSSSWLLTGIFCVCSFSTASAQQPTAQPGARPAAVPSATMPAPPPPSISSLPQTTTAPSGVPAAAQPRPPELRFTVLLDPAHGGADTGAMLDAATTEKSYTLALATRLHGMLYARGIRSILTRDSDVALDNGARATVANRSQASACILLHATATGNGVHLFTSSLPTVTEADARRAFLPWQTAQAAYETASLRLESDVDGELTRQHIPVLLARTSLMPLDSMACPAVAVEIAPFDANTPLADPAYQQKIVDALAAALAAWRSDWRLQP